jgi:hypothetical protein
MVDIFSNLTFINDKIWNHISFHDKYKFWFSEKKYLTIHQKFLIWNQMTFHKHRFWGFEKELDKAKPSFNVRETYISNEILLQWWENLSIFI